MSAGLPVIASNVGGIPKSSAMVKTAGCWKTIPERSPPPFRTLLEDPAAPRDISPPAGRRTVEESFSLDRMVRQPWSLPAGPRMLWKPAWALLLGC